MLTHTAFLLSSAVSQADELTLLSFPHINFTAEMSFSKATSIRTITQRDKDSSSGPIWISAPKMCSKKNNNKNNKVFKSSKLI